MLYCIIIFLILVLSSCDQQGHSQEIENNVLLPDYSKGIPIGRIGNKGLERGLDSLIISRTEKFCENDTLVALISDYRWYKDGHICDQISVIPYYEFLIEDYDVKMCVEKGRIYYFFLADDDFSALEFTGRYLHYDSTKHYEVPPMVDGVIEIFVRYDILDHEYPSSGS